MVYLSQGSQDILGTKPDLWSLMSSLEYEEKEPDLQKMTLKI